ncbi:MAG: hypothetical protein Q9181_003613 [Wetmoreana brouardii]
MHRVLGAPASTLAECDQVVHKQRRAPLDTLFSKNNTNKLEPLLLRNTERLFFAKGRTVEMEWALKSLIMDTVSSSALDDPEFHALAVRVFVQYLHSLHVIKGFPFVRTLTKLPLWLAKSISHEVEMGQELEQVTAPKIDDYLSNRANGKMPEFPTMMERLLVPIPEKGYQVSTSKA